MSLLFFMLAGIVGLYLGSGYLVDAAKRIARLLNISDTLVGLTIISIGTSIPEIMTNFTSGLKIRSGIEASGIAMGTNVGSDITQITFILGITALLGVLYADKSLFTRDGPMVLFALGLLYVFSLTGNVFEFWEGMVMIILYLGYLGLLTRDSSLVKQSKKEIEATKVKGEGIMHYLQNGGLCILSFGILFVSTELVVGSAIKLAGLWGVSQSFIGVLIVGVGTGLPELSTSVRAALQKAQGISLGTIVGSNITNPMLALGVGAIASGTGILVHPDLLRFDIPYLFVVTLLALGLIWHKGQIGRGEMWKGVLLIFAYVLFVFLKISRFA
ncbi:MAG: calcium/sodium antiporter [Nanoarchaeota archaeon]|nr:calcium/sodium antiporter [Nanoarchaeota archaeon]